VEDGNIDENYRKLSRRGPITFDVWDRMDGHTLKRWQRRQLLRKSALLMTIQDLRLRSSAEASTEAGEATAFVQRFDAYLSRLLDECEKLNCRLMVATIPASTSIISEHPGEAAAVQVRAAARAAGLPFLDLLPALKACYRHHGAMPILPYDGHYNAAGNKAMATCCAEHLARAIGKFPAK